MKRISTLEQEIRDFVNEYGLCERHYRSKPDAWHTLCVAMDTLGDTAEALEEFDANGMGSEVGERYLRFYGFTQAVVLQQDAINALGRLFVGQNFRPEDGSGWVELRDLRNLAGGHPISNTTNKQGTTKRTLISRPTLSEKRLTLLLWDQAVSQMRFLPVQLEALYASYKDEVCRYLAEIKAAQRKRWLANTPLK